MPTIVANAGNIVVPLSAILDQLKNKLNSTEIDVLLAAVLAQRKSEVKPGDLITADLMNQILNELADLHTRISALESTGQSSTKVTLKPYIGFAHIGDEITLEGTNFAVPVNLNVVIVGNIRITQFNPGTDDTHLIFNVPNISGVPKDEIVSVTNSTGSASITIALRLPVLTPVGSMVITAVPLNIGAIQVGQTYEFPFVFDSQTNIAETYLVTALFSNFVGSSLSAWSANTHITDLTKQTISKVTVAQGSPVTVRVSVTVPPEATSVDMALQVQSVNAPNDPLLNPVPLPISIVVGQVPQVSDPRTTFEQLMVSPSSRLVNDPQLGQILRTPVKQQTLARVTVNFTVAGNYSYSARVVPADPSGVWSVTVTSPTPPATSEIAGSSQLVISQLSANTQDTPTLSSRTLEIHATRNEPGGENFDSWFTIPIQMTKQ
jgi:hypothetical protein